MPYIKMMLNDICLKSSHPHIIRARKANLTAYKWMYNKYLLADYKEVAAMLAGGTHKFSDVFYFRVP